MDSEKLEKSFKFENVKNFVLSGLSKNELDLKTATENFNSNDEIVKTAIEHSFRIYVLQNIDKMQIEDMKKVIDLSIVAVQKKMCLPTTPIFIINDMLSSLAIDKCSEIFCYLEDSSHVWKSDMFYASVKNYLLRMCNDLLKRLSKSQNTVFSGRIHLFLAKLFPLNEKSGLNLMSHFSDNFTRYTTSPEAFERAINKNKNDVMDTDNGDEASTSAHLMPIDYNLYSKFWSLQEFFSKPNSCYDKASWKLFTANANEVLEALKSYRLEDVKSSGVEEANTSANAANTANHIDDDDDEGMPTRRDEFDDMNLYFSKYLTSEKLLDLQLNDSNFRRQILIQFLVMFQYLNADVKFKTATQVPNEEQNAWIRSASKKVNELIRETPPSGAKFQSHVKKILEREEIWNKWKNEGCPNYVREKRPAAATGGARAAAAAKRLKPTCSDFIANTSSKVTESMGTSSASEIVKLCNVNHDNLEACKDASRLFLPTLREFFDECIEQLDPVNQVDKEYRLINQTDWSWKALRLLAKRSAFYFMQNQNVKTISEYLEVIAGKLAKEFAFADQQIAQRQQKLLQVQQQQLQKQQQQQQQQQQHQPQVQQKKEPQEQQQQQQQQVTAVKQEEPAVRQATTHEEEPVSTPASKADDDDEENDDGDEQDAEATAAADETMSAKDASMLDETTNDQSQPLPTGGVGENSSTCATPQPAAEQVNEEEEEEEEEEEDGDQQEQQDQNEHKAATTTSSVSSNSSSNGSNDGMEKVDDYDEMTDNNNPSDVQMTPTIEHEQQGTAAESAPPKTHMMFDTELVDFVAASVSDEAELVDIALHLRVDVPKDGDANEGLVDKCRKMLQTWTEQDERNDLPMVLLETLRATGRTTLADKLSAKLK